MIKKVPPKGEQVVEARMRFSVPILEYREIQYYATEQGMPMSKFMRECCRKVILDMRKQKAKNQSS